MIIYHHGHLPEFPANNIIQSHFADGPFEILLGDVSEK